MDNNENKTSAVEDIKDSSLGKRKLFNRFLDILRRKFDKFKLGLKIHSSVYIAVNAFLFALNLLTSFHVPWFLFPLGAWGMGLFIHYGVYRFLKRKKEEFERFDYLSPEQMHFLEKYLNSKRNFGIHAYSSVAVTAYMALINSFHNFHPPWFLIVAASLALPLAINGTVQGAISSSYRDKLKKLLKGIKPRVDGDNDQMIDGPPEYLEALNLKKQILGQLNKGHGPQKSLAVEIVPVLDQYAKAIFALSQQSKKYSSALKTLDFNEINKEKQNILNRLETVAADSLKNEYRQALSHTENQLLTYAQLQEKSELINMRIKTSLSSLKKLQIEIMMLEDISSPMSAVNETKTKIEELYQYAADLEAGFRDLNDEILNVED